MKYLTNLRNIRELHRRQASSGFSAIIGGNYEVEPLRPGAVAALAIQRYEV